MEITLMKTCDNCKWMINRNLSGQFVCDNIDSDLYDVDIDGMDDTNYYSCQYWEELK